MILAILIVLNLFWCLMSEYPLIEIVTREGKHF
jgi:hypothetical protein